MYQIQCLNKISEVGTSCFGSNYVCGSDVQNPDAILVRSASMHEMEFNPELLAIARAGAGSDRDMLSIAEMCLAYGDKLTYAGVTSVLGSADFATNAKLVAALLAADPDLSRPEHAPLRRRVEEMFREESFN